MDDQNMTFWLAAMKALWLRDDAKRLPSTGDGDGMLDPLPSVKVSHEDPM